MKYLFSILLLNVSIARAQTAQEMVSKHLQVVGGKAKIMAITSCSYRLKQIDIDARHVYGGTEKVEFSKSIAVRVYPNPARNTLLIEGAENYTMIRLINMQGIVVKKMKGAANLRVDVGNLPSGQYFLRLTGNSEEQTISFMKQ